MLLQQFAFADKYLEISRIGPLCIPLRENSVRILSMSSERIGIF